MLKRKRYAPVLVLLIVALTLSACGGDRLEVFPFWTGKDARRFDRLANTFKVKHPTVQFVNLAAGVGPGVDEQFVLNTLLEAGDPPDSWNGFAGQSLIGQYAAGRQIQPLNDLYEAQGWFDVLPKGLIPLISQDGNIYSVPIDIHRTNLLWYNPAVLEANGVSVPATMNDWFLAMDAIQAAGITPLAIGDREPHMVLLEVILLSSLGLEKYTGLWKGSVNWGSEDVKTALDNYQKALTYARDDLEVTSWQDATERVSTGSAAFIVMGDRVHGYFRERGKALGSDYNWVVFPGTEGIFQFYADSFVLAENTLNEKNAMDWLAFLGSTEAQEAFNVTADSICPRTDCNPLLFDEYAKASMSQWSTDTLTGSMTYGVFANNIWRAEIDAALAQFLEDNDLKNFQTALAAACKNSGPCP